MKTYNKGAENDGRQRTPFVPDGTAALRSLSLENVVFVNVEGVPELADPQNLTDSMLYYWDQISKPLRTDDQTAADVYCRAGEFGEFGKVACVTAGVIRHREEGGQPFFITTSYCGDDERTLLSDFADMLGNFFADKNDLHYLCGHAIWQKDAPFLGKRFLINGLPLPSLFDSKGRKPLRALLIDTQEYWTFSNHNATCVPADLLAGVFGIDAETSDFDPAEASRLYHDEHDLDSIRERSERKVLLYAQLLRRFRGEGIIDSSHIIRKE